MPKKKLIETGMPVPKINTEAARERAARSGMPSAVHMWWSRTPMAITRSVLFAALVDDPLEHPEMFNTQEEQDAERERLLQMTEQLAKVESAGDKELLRQAAEEVRRSTSGKIPLVFDPFAGSGTTPVEAHRLGLQSVSSDLNPVAAMITTVVSDIPGRFAGRDAVHPEDMHELFGSDQALSGFADDVYYYGKQIQEEAFRRIGHLYPKTGVAAEGDVPEGTSMEVTAWIWARTIKCPNPNCGCNIPLSSSYDLARKKGSEVWVEPVIEEDDIRFRIHRGSHPQGKALPKVAAKAVFRCPKCGEITPDAYVKECGMKHRIDSRLIAIASENENGRSYLEATADQEMTAKCEAPDEVPHGQLPQFPRRFSPPSFGLTDYADLFTDRQLVYLTTMLDLAKEKQSEIERAAIEKGYQENEVHFADGGSGALAYAEAIRMVLALTVSKLTDRCSNLCSWDASGPGSLRNVFSRAAMPMIWDYAEANPFAGASGDFLNTLSRTCAALCQLSAGVSGSTWVADGAAPSGIREALVFTELPYYDKVAYQELSDFFYVWLKYGLEDLYPDRFTAPVTTRQQDMTAFPYRYDGEKKLAETNYVDVLRAAMKNLHQSSSPEYPACIRFIYNGNDGQGEELSHWEQFITAVSDAGYDIIASWPLGRKYEKKIEQAEARGIPVIVVLRTKIAEMPSITRRSFVATVKRELPGIIAEMHAKAGIMDLRTSVIGRALHLYTRNGQVLDADGSEMKPYMASRIIEQEIDMIIANYYDEDVVKSVHEEEISHG